MKTIFINHYSCDQCGTTWTDEWECACNDRCPKCNAEIEPDSYETREEEGEEQADPDFPVFTPYENLPKLSVLIILDGGIINECILIEDNRLDIGYYRELFNFKLTGFGFRPIRVNESILSYYDRFANYRDMILDGNSDEDIIKIHPESDPTKFDYEDDEIYWRNFDDPEFIYPSQDVDVSLNRPQHIKP